VRQRPATIFPAKTMIDQRERCVCCGQCLREVLLGHLQAPEALPWPGADGLTVEEVLASYVLAARQGCVPDQEELCRRHPDLVPEVLLFFDQGLISGRCGA